MNLIVRDGSALPPRGSTEIEAGDELHIVARLETIPAVQRLAERWRDGPLGPPEIPSPAATRRPAGVLGPAVERRARRRSRRPPRRSRASPVAQRLRTRRDGTGVAGGAWPTAATRRPARTCSRSAGAAAWRNGAPGASRGRGSAPPSAPGGRSSPAPSAPRRPRRTRPDASGATSPGPSRRSSAPRGTRRSPARRPDTSWSCAPGALSRRAVAVAGHGLEVLERSALSLAFEGRLLVRLAGRVHRAPARRGALPSCPVLAPDSAPAAATIAA